MDLARDMTTAAQHLIAAPFVAFLVIAVVFAIAAAILSER